jgi:hypothetical protein
MNICEALKAGRTANKAIKRYDWPKEVYVYHGMDNVLRIVGDGSGDRELTVSVNILSTNDWGLSEEPYHGPLEPLSVQDDDDVKPTTIFLTHNTKHNTPKELPWSRIGRLYELPGFQYAEANLERHTIRFKLYDTEYLYLDKDLPDVLAFVPYPHKKGVYYEADSKFICASLEEFIAAQLNARNNFVSQPRPLIPSESIPTPQTSISPLRPTTIAELPGYKLLHAGDSYKLFKIGDKEYLDTECGCAGIYCGSSYICRTEEEFVAIMLREMLEH